MSMSMSMSKSKPSLSIKFKPKRNVYCEMSRKLLTANYKLLTGVRMGGLEPPRLSPPDPKSGAATITPHPQNLRAQKYTFFPNKEI